MNNMKMLEEKIGKVIGKIKTLTEDNNELNSRNKKLQEELKKKEGEITAIKQDIKNIDKLKAHIAKLNDERELVKTQVEDLIRELESADGS